jgi:hypothetical protein
VHYLMLQYRQCPVKLIVAKPAMQHEVKLTDRQRAEAVADLFELAVSSKRTSIPTKCCA